MQVLLELCGARVVDDGERAHGLVADDLQPFDPRLAVA
jgi:hypothetical protein